jgi:phytoene/squalene synthetase
VAVEHYENFPVASILLPAALRAPVEVIYRFARSADDFADEGADPAGIRLQKLQGYREQLDAPREPLFHDVRKIVREHGLPLELFRDLLDAFSQDVTKKRYADYAELLDYCRRSANPVGRLLLHLFKRTTETCASPTPSAPRCSSSTTGRTSRSTTRRTTASICLRTTWLALGFLKNIFFRKTPTRPGKP